ncbi:MAG: hypothetical protein WCG47_10370 [Dermatophilaceae bacterium]
MKSKNVTRISALAVIPIVAGVTLAGPAQAQATDTSRTEALASNASGANLTVAPAVTKRNIYISETACNIAGWWGYFWGGWTFYWCVQRSVPGDDRPWYQLYTIP